MRNGTPSRSMAAIGKWAATSRISAPRRCPSLEEVLDRERARGGFAVTGAGIDRLGWELRAEPPQQGSATGAIEVDEKNRSGSGTQDLG